VILSALVIVAAVLWTVFSLLLPLAPLADMAGIVLISLVAMYAILNEGLRKGLGFLAISTVIGLFFEVVGVSFGVPFGRYHYNQVEPLLFGLVPSRVVLLWFVITYTAKSLTDVLIGSGGSRWNVAATCFLDALIATSWDLVMDPVMVNLFQWWTWETPGFFLGVPVSNYAGWLLVSFVVCSVYRLCGSAPAQTATPIVVYFSLCWPLMLVCVYNSQYELLSGGIVALLISAVALLRYLPSGLQVEPDVKKSYLDSCRRHLM